MGNQNCSLADRQINNHQAYGSFQIEIYYNKSFAVITKTMNDRNGLKESLQMSLNKRKNIEHQGLCQLLEYGMEKKDTVTIISLTYEYISDTLYDKAELMRHKRMSFLEDDLIQLGQDVSGTLKELYRNKIRHGCINSQSILWNGAGYKITDVSSTTYMTLIDLMREGKIPQPISQKMASLFNQGKYKFQISKMVELDDDLFSLGIVILEMGTGISLKELYKITKTHSNRIIVDLNIEAIENYVFLLKKKYSSKLQKIVKKLVGLGIESRYTSTSPSQKNLVLEKKPREQHCYDEPFDFSNLFC